MTFIKSISAYAYFTLRFNSQKIFSSVKGEVGKY